MDDFPNRLGDGAADSAGNGVSHLLAHGIEALEQDRAARETVWAVH